MNELKILTETFIYKFVFIDIGLFFIYGIFTLLRKFLPRRIFIQVICAILTIINCVIVFLIFILFFIKGYTNNFSDYWILIPSFIIYSVHVIRAIMQVRKDGWKELL